LVTGHRSIQKEPAGRSGCCIYIGGEEEIYTGAVRWFAVAGNNLVDVNAAELRELAANALAAAAELDALTGAG